MKLIAKATIVGVKDADGETPVKPGKSFEISDAEGQVLVKQGFAEADNTKRQRDQLSPAQNPAVTKTPEQIAAEQKEREDAEAKAKADAEAAGKDTAGAATGAAKRGR